MAESHSTGRNQELKRGKDVIDILKHHCVDSPHCHQHDKDKYDQLLASENLGTNTSYLQGQRDTLTTEVDELYLQREQLTHEVSQLQHRVAGLKTAENDAASQLAHTAQQAQNADFQGPVLYAIAPIGAVVSSAIAGRVQGANVRATAPLDQKSPHVVHQHTMRAASGILVDVIV